MSKRWVALLIITGMLVLVLAGCVDLNRYLVLEPFQLPALTGPFAVGTCRMQLTDSGRTETFLWDRSSENREMMVRFWYPAKESAGTAVDYMDKPSAIHYASEFKIDPDNGIKMMTLIQTHAVEGAAPAAGQFPVLVFSPGLNSNVCAYQTMLESVASRGYIVAAVDHPYISGLTVFPDGRSIAMDPSMERLEPIQRNFRIVVEDLKFLIAELQRLKVERSSPLSGSMDLSRLGAFGQSFGGAASVRLAMEEPACKAAVNLDGWLEGDGYDRPLKTPLLFLAGDSYTDSTDPNWNVIWAGLGEGYRVRIKGATHLNFGDLGMIGHHFFPDIPTQYFRVRLGDVVYWRLGKIDPGLAVEITDAYIGEFFDVALKGAPPEPLQALAAKYKVVEFEKR